ncbi:uncharacterized protein LOC135808175 [Sycon ciliatum]|uniref:uncharacterized protein LOC135808175 n=1 Tax=Sycon ciliatum TaxID=27933 RepID=UPI0031F6FF35
MVLSVALKCRLVRGLSEEQNHESWSPEIDTSEIISIRRRQLVIDNVAAYTLQQFLSTLQLLFIDDVITASKANQSEGHSVGTPDDNNKVTGWSNAARADADPSVVSKKEPHRVRIWMKSPSSVAVDTVDQDSSTVYTLMTCDMDIQLMLHSIKDGTQLNVDMQLMKTAERYPVGTHGVLGGDDGTDGPFPIDPGDTHVSTPVGGGLVESRLTCDVFVAGAGSAGLGAALSAARSGASVICAHGRKVVGGNSSSEVKLNMVGADISGGRGVELQTEAREGGILEEIRLDNSVYNAQWCPEMWDLTMLDKFRTLPNMNLLLNTWFVSCTLDDNGSITSVVAECQLTQRRYIITAKVYIDTTGDGRLGAEAKCQWRQGREAQSEYKESLAMLTADTATEGSSLAFTTKDMGRPTPFSLPTSYNRRFTAEDFAHRKLASYDYGYWWIELSWPYDNVSDQNTITAELHQALLGVWDYMKNSGGELAEKTKNLALDWFGYYPCKREARRLKGLYTMTQNDMVPTPAAFSDTVCHGGWGLDLHNPKGINDPDMPPFSSTHTPYIYGTPLRCFVSADVSNMMMAGRLASFTHVAFGSQRVMATCCVHGQGAGTAAAYAALHGMTPQQVAKDPDAVWSVQQQLLRDDQFVIGQVNQDPRDKALTATATATSEQDIGPATAVTSGQTRAVFGKGGCMTSQSLPGTNRWISNGLPATLTLMFKEPIASVGQVELVFDSGLFRLLTFTMKKAHQEKMVWGQAQPELVKDYSIEALPVATNSWQTLTDVEDNHQRKRVHMIGYAEKCSGIRITVTATNGIADARICEVRVYEIGNGGKFPVKPKGLQPHPLLTMQDHAQASLHLAAPPEPTWWRETDADDIAA